MILGIIYSFQVRNGEHLFNEKHPYLTVLSIPKIEVLSRINKLVKCQSFCLDAFEKFIFFMTLWIGCLAVTDLEELDESVTKNFSNLLISSC